MTGAMGATASGGAAVGSSADRGEPLPLTTEDLSILALEDEMVAGHTCKVVILEDRIDPDALRASIASRLHRAPRLCLRLADVDGEPRWEPTAELDLNEQVVVAGDADPVDLLEFRTTVARTFGERLDRTRPLWRIDVVPELTWAGSALIWRIHHALADGFAAMQMAEGALWDEQPQTGVGQGRRRKPPASDTSHQRTAHARLTALRTAMREAPQPWLRSPFGGRICAEREVAFASVELEGLRTVARIADRATLNDAILAVVAGGLHRWLERQHGHLGAVRVKVPVSLHAPAAVGENSAEPGNRDSFFCLDLPVGVADPLKRLAAIRRATRMRKDGHDAQRLDALMRDLTKVPRLRRFAERALAHPRAFALNVSNVVGPRRPCSVVGARVHELYSLAEIREHHALRISVISLCDSLNFGLVADPTLVEDVAGMAADIESEAATLLARVKDV